MFRQLSKDYFENENRLFKKKYKIGQDTAVKLFGKKDFIRSRGEKSRDRIRREYSPLLLLGLTYMEILELYDQGYIRSEILNGHWEIDENGNQHFLPKSGTK